MTYGTARNILLLAVLLYIGVIAWFSPLVIQDYPNHLARGLIMADLIFHHGAEFGSTYRYHFLFTPYVLGDLILAVLVAVAGVSVAGAAWVMVTFLSLPLSLYAYLRARQTSADVTLLMLLISLYLSTDTFFVMGFTEFKLSMAIVFVALALMELLRRRWSLLRYVAFVAVVVASYLAHLAATVFIGAAVGVSAVWGVVLRRARIVRELLLIAPVVAAVAWHELVAIHYREPTDLINQFSVWGTPARKLSHLIWDLLRYNIYQELVLLALLAAFLGCACRERLPRKSSHVLEPLAYAGVFLVLYLALPWAQTEASYIDVRTLTLIPVFLILGILNLPRRATSTGTVVQCLAIALVAANLAVLAFHFRKSGIWLAQYRSIVAKIPEHSAVLPIYTGGHNRNLYTYLHVASFAVMDRHALIPYQFSGNVGSPMKYFRYEHLPYAPTEFWYDEGRDVNVDWRRIHDTYQYALIMKPFSPARIPLQGHIVAQNDAAELLALDRATR
ncbi:MAG: hypothetical protein JSR66_15175 [Proteobacteria bacterium]|nr:hypothetical protein [Pseudomonadota bacterium]